MPTIQITDQLGASIQAQLMPAAALLKYVRDLPGLILEGGDLSQWRLLTLGDPAVRFLAPALQFQQPVSFGTNGPELTVQAEAGVSFQVIGRAPGATALLSPDDYGDNIEIPEGSCYVATGFHVSGGAGIGATAGSLAFGLEGDRGIEIESYRPFPAGAGAPTIADALRTSIGEFVIPAAPADLEALPAGVIVTVTGSGSLKFSATSNLLAVVNPLATVALPSPVPAISVQQGASVSVGASWEISSEYQVRVQKTDARRVRVGWYRRHGSEFAVTASASAGITAGLGSTDLFAPLIRAISSDAQADLDALERAGLSEDRAAGIQGAVQAAVNRKLELALAAEFGALGSDEAAFLYEVDLGALDNAGRDAVRAALAGDLSRLADTGALPAGVTAVRSIFSQASATRFSLRVNLLGIFNYASVSSLALDGSVTFTPSTGELVIADEATSSIIQTAAVNFGANEDKLRHVMAESFLITAAYRGSRSVVAPPELASSHVFFKMDRSTSLDELRRSAAIASALGLAPAPVPPGIDDFGATSVLAEARYGDALARALFLGADGTPRAHTEYETAGRQAVARLVPPDGDDAFRRRPATDDVLWNRMKDLGPANFQQLLPQAQADGVRPDYVAIQWWADSMCSTAEVLSRMDRFFTANAGASPDDPRFQELRTELAGRLRDVAGKAREQFGEPWGLVAMFLVSGGRAHATVQITGPRYVVAAESPLAAGGRSV